MYCSAIINSSLLNSINNIIPTMIFTNFDFQTNGFIIHVDSLSKKDLKIKLTIYSIKKTLGPNGICLVPPLEISKWTLSEIKKKLSNFKKKHICYWLGIF